MYEIVCYWVAINQNDVLLFICVFQSDVLCFLSYLCLLTHSQNISGIRNEFLNIFLQTHFEFPNTVTLKNYTNLLKLSHLFVTVLSQAL